MTYTTTQQDGANMDFNYSLDIVISLVIKQEKTQLAFVKTSSSFEWIIHSNAKSASFDYVRKQVLEIQMLNCNELFMIPLNNN